MKTILRVVVKVLMDACAFTRGLSRNQLQRTTTKRRQEDKRHEWIEKESSLRLFSVGRPATVGRYCDANRNHADDSG